MNPKDIKREVILKEMDLIQANIRNYDSILFRIKGWSITAFSAFAFFAFKENTPILTLIAILPTIVFWNMEAIFKRFQRGLIVRNREIEKYLRKLCDGKPTPEDYDQHFPVPDFFAHDSTKNRKLKVSTLRAAFYPHVRITYVSIILMCFILYLGFDLIHPQ